MEDIARYKDQIKPKRIYEEEDAESSVTEIAAGP